MSHCSLRNFAGIDSPAQFKFRADRTHDRVRAVETVDACVGQLLKVVDELNGRCVWLCGCGCAWLWVCGCVGVWGGALEEKSPQSLLRPRSPPPKKTPNPQKKQPTTASS